MAQGSEDIIDSYVDRAGVKGDTDFMVTQLNEVFTQFKKIKDLNIDLGGLQSFKAVGDSVKRLKVEMDELQRIELGLIKTYEKRQAAFSNQAKDLALEKEYLRQRNNELRTSAKENIAAEGSINQLRASLIRLRNEYDNLGKAQREASKGTELLKSIQALDAEVKKLEADSGRFQRNVGNYASGFNGLSNSINQISRELPNFALNAQTGILALSNNIPILADEIQRLKVRNAELIAQGKPTESVFKQIAAAAFSWQTAMSLAITIATVYGKEIIEFTSSLINGAKGVDELRESQQLLNDTLNSSDFKNAVQEFDEMQNVIQLAKDGVIDKKRALDEYNEGLGLVIGKANSLNEAERLMAENSEAYLKAIFLRTKAHIALEKSIQASIDADLEREQLATRDQNFFEKTLGRLSPGPNPLSVFNTVRGAEGAKAKDDLSKFFKDISDEANAQLKNIKGLNLTNLLLGDDKDGGAKTQEQKFQADLKAQLELRKRAIQELIDLENTTVTNESLTANVRIASRQRVFELEKKIAEEEKAFALQAIDQKQAKELEQARNSIKNSQELARAITIINQNAENERLLAVKDANDKEAELKTDLLVDTINIRKQISDREKKEIDELNAFIERELKKQAEGQVGVELRRFNEAINAINARAEVELAIELKKYEKGEISKKEYEARKLEIENKTRRASLEAEIEYQKAILNIVNLPEAEREKALKKLNELQKRLRDQNFKEEEKDVDKRIANQERLKDALINLGTELKDTLFSILGAGIENQKNQIQEQIDLVEQRKQKEIEAVNQTTQNRQDAANQIAIIEARANAQREQLEKRRRELDQQRARYEKIKNIADIIQSTALAVVNTLADKTLPTPTRLALAVVVGAIGAAQLAKAIATPIPRYFKGKNVDDFYEGPAWVDDGGKPEAIIRENGEVEIGTNQPRITWLNKRDIVLPDAKMLALAAHNKTHQTITANYKGESLGYQQFAGSINSTLNKGFKSVVTTIKSQPQPLPQRGFNKELLMKYGSDYRKYI